MAVVAHHAQTCCSPTHVGNQISVVRKNLQIRVRCASASTTGASTTAARGGLCKESYGENRGYKKE